MNKQRRRKTDELIRELRAIQAEVGMIRDAEKAEASSILSALEVEALTEAGAAIGEAINLLAEAVA